MKKTLRKWLSLFLAVVMAITSLGTGLVALAAESDPNDPYQALADALKADGVQAAAWPAEADGNAVSVDDPTGDITQAAEAFWQLVAARYQDDYQNQTYSRSGVYGSDYTMQGVKEKISEALQNDRYGMGAYWAQAERALNCFVAYQNGDGMRAGTKSVVERLSYPYAPQAADYVFTVNRSVADQLLAADDLDDLPDTLCTAVSYQWHHDAQNLYTESAAAGKWLKVTYYTGYRNLVWTASSRTTAGEDNETVPALKAFSAYFTPELLATDLAALGRDGLQAILADGRACIDALGDLWSNTAVMNHFFDKAAVESFMADVQAACGSTPAAEEEGAASSAGSDIGLDLDLNTLLDQSALQKRLSHEDKQIIVGVTVAIVAVVSIILSVLYYTGVTRFATPVESTEGKYLFCYFVGNTPQEEKIHFAVSEDGYNFTPLNGNEPIVENTAGTKSVRDPYILQGQDGKFYIVATDMKSEDGWTSNHALVTWESSDLIHWSEPTILDIRDFGGEFANTNRAWAPQAIWDPEAGQYMVYWANSTLENDSSAIYYAYMSDFKTWNTRPQLLYERPGVQTIDADIVYNEKSGMYYLYFKFEEDQTIAYVKSENLTGPYASEPVTVSLAPTGVEGSTMYNITGTDAWVMLMDEYGEGRFFAQQTTDMEHFEKLARWDYSLDFSPRHGSVIPITDEQYSALLAAYGT